MRLRRATHEPLNQWKCWVGFKAHGTRDLESLVLIREVWYIEFPFNLFSFRQVGFFGRIDRTGIGYIGLCTTLNDAY